MLHLSNNRTVLVFSPPQRDSMVAKETIQARMTSMNAVVKHTLHTCSHSMHVERVESINEAI